MYNYLINIEYDGLKYVGWQKQLNGVSIQEIIEKTIKKVLKDKIRLIGSGRTDKGVHAINQCANFITSKKIEDKIKFLDSTNFFLNRKSISILDLKKKKLNFHSRFSALERCYEYIIINRIASLSLMKNKAWHVKIKLDLDLLKKGAKILEGQHDFSTFRASSCSARSPIKKMNSINIKRVNDKIIIEFFSKSFLQNQVRSMVGCLKYLASKKWSFKKFKDALNSKNRKNCAPPAPAHGLYLKKVKY